MRVLRMGAKYCEAYRLYCIHYCLRGFDRLGFAMIYATPFDPETKVCTAPSSDSGLSSLAEVVEMMGADALKITRQMVVYPGVLFTIFPWALLDAVASSAVQSFYTCKSES